jgi:hypothetical protein
MSVANAAASEAKRKVEALRREMERLREESERADKARREELIKVEERATKGLREVEIALQRATGDEAGAAFAEIEQKYAELIADLKLAGMPAGIALVERLINLEKVDAQLAIFRQKMQEAASASDATIGSLAGQAAGGLINSGEADKGREDALARELAIQQQLLKTARAYLGTLSAGSPEATKTLQFIEQLNGRIGEVQATQNQFAADVKSQAVNALSSFFNDLATGAKSFKDAFLDMVRSFVQGIAQMIAQKLALKAVEMIASSFHTGGLVGGGGGRRSVNPMLFGAAPRYHSGGIAGLAPNEVPAILQRGEEVITRRDARHRLNGGGQGGGGRVKTPIVVLGERALADALAGAAGEDVVLTHVRNNWGSLSGGQLA